MHDWNALLTAATGRVARLIDEVDLTASVPACPEWCVADLVEHLGSVHQWARHAVLEGATDVPGGADPVRIGDGEPHVHLRGTARELLLLLWHRATTDDPAAAPLLAEAITP